MAYSATFFGGVVQFACVADGAGAVSSAKTRMASVCETTFADSLLRRADEIRFVILRGHGAGRHIGPDVTRAVAPMGRYRVTSSQNAVKKRVNICFTGKNS